MVKSVVICMEAGAKRQPQLSVGLDAARAFGAAAVGLCVIVTPPIQAYAEAPVALEVYEEELRRRRAQAQELEREFRDAAARAKVEPEWRSVEGDWLELGLAHGRIADLVVLAQDDPDEPAARELEQLVLALGRPALVTPYVGAERAVGGKAVVAWNGSREATRAAHDAIPFLRRASETLIVAIDPSPAAEASAERLVAHLGRHGAKASFKRLTAAGVDPGAVLLNCIADESAELLVMGAYGHSRMRELVLGGATRTVFRQMTAPVLMSH